MYILPKKKMAVNGFWGFCLAKNSAETTPQIYDIIHSSLLTYYIIKQVSIKMAPKGARHLLKIFNPSKYNITLLNASGAIFSFDPDFRFRRSLNKIIEACNRYKAIFLAL
jgi:hypothetical protein